MKKKTYYKICIKSKRFWGNGCLDFNIVETNINNAINKAMKLAGEHENYRLEKNPQLYVDNVDYRGYIYF
jgi:hypothetical protein